MSASDVPRTFENMGEDGQGAQNKTQQIVITLLPMAFKRVRELTIPAIHSFYKILL